MQKKIVGLTIIGLAVAGLSFGQIKKQFSVEGAPSCEQIKFKLKANSGTCFIKPSHNPEILDVFSNQGEEQYAHQYVKETNGKVCQIMLSLEEEKSEGFTQTVSSRVFGSENSAVEKFWKMYLTDTKPYALDLNYGVGNANVDLSGLAVKNLKITSGSANVNITYHSGLGNLIEMDTFSVKVDMGSVHAKNLNLAKTKCVVANVGFGSVMLDLSATPEAANHIKGSVGAGNLVILLPTDDSVPVLVKIKDSWLCSIKLTEDLKETSTNTYANAAYAKNPKNALTFDLDVSLGNIIFKEKQ